MNRRARRAAAKRSLKNHPTPLVVESPYGREEFDDVTDALVYGAMHVLCDRGLQWSKEMGRPQSDLAFIVVHESAPDVMNQIRSADRDPFGMTDVPNAFAVATGTRAEIEQWCDELGLQTIVGWMKERLERVPVVVLYDDVAGLRWLMQNDEGLAG